MFHTKNILNRMMSLRLLASVGFAVLLLLAPTGPALAATAPSLGNAQSFAVLGASAVSNTGTSVITGDLGIAPGLASSVTGFPPGIVTGGTIHAGAVIPDPLAAAAQADAGTAFNDLDQPCTTTYPVGNKDLGGLTLTPGVYCSTSSFSLTGTLTLNALGDPNAVWIFKMPASTLTTATDSVVRMINGGQDCNVFWRVGSSATLQTRTTFIGTIIANTSITLVTNASMSGRALALNGAVTMDTNNIFATVCSGVPPSVAPTLGKAFSPVTIDAGGLSTLTITLSNPNTSVATLSTPLIDTLPPGVTIAATPNASTTCSGAGAVAAIAGGSTVTLPTTRSIPAGSGATPGTCTVTVNVTAATAGSYVNTLLAGALQTSNGNNAAPAIATLTVNPPVGVVPPTLGKAFSPVTINAGVGNSSTLTITLSNPNLSVATLSAPLTDTLPSGVTTVGPAITDCGGTPPTTTASSVTLPTGATIPSGTCTVTVNVTAPLGGNFINTLAAGALQTSNGNNATPAIATLTVVSPNAAPTLGKAFSPATINAGVGNSSTLTITLSNLNASVATLSAPLTDTLPSGVTTVGPATTDCGGTAPTTTASSVTLPSGATIPSGTCTVTVNVTAPLGGNFINTLLAGALQTSNGSNAAPAIATLTVVSLDVPPSLGKGFSPVSINAGGVSTLTITLSNPNTSVATLNEPLTDTLPTGMVIAPTPNASTTCGGGATVTATAGENTVTLTGGSIPAAGTCTVTVDVTAATAGAYLNTLVVGALQTSNGSNTLPAIVTLTVVPLVPPRPAGSPCFPSGA